MNFNTDTLFDTPKGKKIYAESLRMIKDFNLEERILEGVAIGFSGGADSVMLALVLKKITEFHGSGKLCAVHVNHLIRGEEAFRDEEFSRDFCERLGIEFLSFRRDVPLFAKRLSKGLEETARDVRYSIFNDLIQGRNDISSVAVAHNSTDNFETIILNMMRGAGARGLSGIPPVRDFIIRPLIYSSKQDIVAALEEAGIPYVTDSTNFDVEYRRNYVRHQIIPAFLELSENPETMVARSSRLLREDADYIEASAKKFIAEFEDGKIPSKALSELHPALFARVIAYMAKSSGSLGVEHTHISKIRDLLSSGNLSFSLDLPGGVSFIADGGFCSVGVLSVLSTQSYQYLLEYGNNTVSEIDAQIIVSESPINEFSSNVYKIAIQQAIDFDIIEGRLSVREKRDGDSYVFGGMTRKLKKLFNDKSLTQSERLRTPIICDEKGILWVPGFRVRDGVRAVSGKKLYIAIAYKA